LARLQTHPLPPVSRTDSRANLSLDIIANTFNSDLKKEKRKACKFSQAYAPGTVFFENVSSSLVWCTSADPPVHLQGYISPRL